MVCDISDADTAVEDTLRLLASEDDDKVLRVARHPTRPISSLILVHRRCNAAPTRNIKQLVQALSCQNGMRSFTGESCHAGEYIGNNPWGKWMQKRTTFCPGCGYAMEGPILSRIIIVKSDDSEWMERIMRECKMGEMMHDGKNLGIAWEIAD